MSYPFLLLSLLLPATSGLSQVVLCTTPSQRSTPNRRLERSGVPRALSFQTSDMLPVVLAAALAGAAGYLQYSVSNGEKGIGAFLLKEVSL